ncbi:MAG TPA: RDD family protein [Blastocatellia bacterium]|nr:RDD family protein [Blastocatellia bacterium]
MAKPTEQSYRGQRARPSAASSPGIPVPGVGLRCGAFLIDYILTLLILAVPLVAAVYIKRRLLQPTVANIVVTLGYLAAAGLLFFNLIYFYVKKGQSLGKTFIGLRVVRMDGKRIDYKTAILRHLVGYPLSFFTFGLGMIWMFLDNKQQGWHDKIAKTVVVKVRS